MWTKSSFCGDAGSCVEAKVDGKEVVLKDSLGKLLRMPSDVWVQLLDDFDADEYIDNARLFLSDSARDCYGLCVWPLDNGATIVFYGGYATSRDLSTVTYTSNEIDAFVQGIRAGDFNHFNLDELSHAESF